MIALLMPAAPAFAATLLGRVSCVEGPAGGELSVSPGQGWGLRAG